MPQNFNYTIFDEPEQIVIKTDLTEQKDKACLTYKIAPYQEEAIKALLDDKYTLYLFCGGRESGKSTIIYTFLEMIFRNLHGSYYANILLLRNTKDSAKKTIFLNTVGKILSNLGVKIEDFESRDLSRGIVKINGHLIRIDSFSFDYQNTEKLKGYEGVTHVIIEELAEVPTPDMFDQLYKTINRMVQVTGWQPVFSPYTGEITGYKPVKVERKGKIICTFNTPPKNHWLIERFYDLQDVDGLEASGYQKLVPKTGPIPGSNLKWEDLPIFYSFSTIYDNTAYIQKLQQDLGLQGYKIHLFDNHEKWKVIDPYKYYTETLGLVGTGRKGLVFNNWQEISLQEYEQITEPEFYGIDFGFSEDYTSVCGVKYVPKKDVFSKPKLYVRPIIFSRGLLTSTLAALIKSKIDNWLTAEFYSDHKPEAIAELEIEKINVRRAIKGQNSKVPSVLFLLNFDIYYVDQEIEITKPNGLLEKRKLVSFELENYQWLVDKNGVPTNEISDGNDHFLDSVRYAVFTKLHPQNQSATFKLQPLWEAFAQNKI